MSIFNIFSNQLSAVIEWKNPKANVIWWKYPSKRDEIINASKLIVAPSQGCALVYEGSLVEMIEQEGIYNLKTDNHPFITTLVNLRQNFESEHKLKIYFFRKAQILNQRWGTPSPIKFIDTTYKIPVELGLNGNFSYKIANPQYFYTEIIGETDELEAKAISSIITERILQLIAQLIHNKKYSYIEIDGKIQDIAQDIKSEINVEYQNLGLELTDFRILGTQFDEATQERIGRVADISADVQAAKEAGLDYVELEKLRALRDAARNEGGLAGAGLQFGVGMELGRKFNEQTDSMLTKGSADVAEQLRKLKILLDENIITAEDFELKKQEILRKI
ncbi:SPFH domain-containing protein [Moraxella canis]|uniref:SPFH domain-containing protein n=2 Tax=Moraxella TaxID=475 RepID=A0ABZ0WZ84_9GAMM|nr:SPFH domain-containing protein [Moraxella canis]WQE04536.1 SPFH domain-containing protein [Moraxella canis]